MCLSMLPKTSTFKSLSYCKTPFNIPRFGRKYFSYSQHVGTSVRVAQSTFAFKCVSQLLTFCLFQCQHISLRSLPQIRVNCRAGRALEHTEGLLWDFVIKESKIATRQLGLHQPNQPLSTSQTKCQSQTKTSCNICMFRCKTCPFRARTQTPVTNFPGTRRVLVHASMAEESSTIWSQRLHPSPESSVVHTPPPPSSCHLLVPPDYQWGFFGG